MPADTGAAGASASSLKAWMRPRRTCSQQQSAHQADDGDDGRLQPPPPRFLRSGETVYTVEKILDHRTGKRKNLKEFAQNKTGQQSSGQSQLSSAAVILRPCCDSCVAQCKSASTQRVTASMNPSTVVRPQGMLHIVCAETACQTANGLVDRWT